MLKSKTPLTGPSKPKPVRAPHRAKTYTIKKQPDGRWAVLDQEFRCHGAFKFEQQAKDKKDELDAL